MRSCPGPLFLRQRLRFSESCQREADVVSVRLSCCRMQSSLRRDSRKDPEPLR